MSIEEMTKEACFEKLLTIKGGVVCEELIVQSSIMESIHPSSVNTVRVPTIRDKDGVHVFHPFFRTGVGDGIIDNAASGGIFSLVDSESGIIISKAMDESGNTYIAHPDTGVKFPGFQLPDWEQAVELVTSLAYVKKENHYVGWDLAHTKNGWIMVEGNPRGQLIMQFFYRNGVKEEIEKYIANM